MTRNNPYYIAIDTKRQKQLKKSSCCWNGPFPFDDNAYFLVCNRETKKRVAEGLNFVQAQDLLDTLAESMEVEQ